MSLTALNRAYSNYCNDAQEKDELVRQMTLYAQSEHIFSSRDSKTRCAVLATARLNMDSRAHIDQIMRIVNDPTANFGTPPSQGLLDAKISFERIYATVPDFHCAVYNAVFQELSQSSATRRDIIKVLRKLPDAGLRNDTLIMAHKKKAKKSDIFDFVAAHRCRPVMARLEGVRLSESEMERLLWSLTTLIRDGEDTNTWPFCDSCILRHPPVQS